MSIADPAYHREYYKKNRGRLYEVKRAGWYSRREEKLKYVDSYLKDNACVDCGEADPVVLEFDHRNPEEKHKCISKMTYSGHSLEALKAEIAKCDIRCANCHKRRTAKQFGWRKHKKNISVA